MRAHALFLTAVVALLPPGLASANEEDPDGEYVAFPTKSVTLGIQSHGTRIAGHYESGVGPVLELALGRGRWQYTVEGSWASANKVHESWPPAAPDMDVGGGLLRGGLGLRWLARQFSPSSNAGVELFLHSLVGMQRYRFEDGARMTRPEVSLGFGIQGRVYRRPRLAFRLDARVLFTPSDTDSALVWCRGMCASSTGSAAGFATGIGLAW